MFVNPDQNQIGLNNQLLDAMRRRDINHCQNLLNQDADVNALDNCGKGTLMWAAGKGYPEIVKLLLENGADVNARDKQGSTALMCALKRGYPKVEVLLLQGYEDVNVLDNCEYAALMRAAGKGYPEIVKLLLLCGAHWTSCSVVYACIKQIQAEKNILLALERYKLLCFDFSNRENCLSSGLLQEIWIYHIISNIASTSDFEAAGLTGNPQEITQKLSEIIEFYKELELSKPKRTAALLRRSWGKQQISYPSLLPGDVQQKIDEANNQFATRPLSKEPGQGCNIL